MATIPVSVSNTLITGTDATDSIYVYDTAENVTVNALDGNDSIRNKGRNVTIFGGTGNDSVYNYGAGMVYVYQSDDGNDYIYGFEGADVIFIPDGTWSTQVSYYDVIVTVGDDKITLQGAAKLDTVSIVSSMAGISPINVIKNTQSNTFIAGNAGRDSVYNLDYSNVTITSGDGDDSISNYGSNGMVSGGTGNDYIYNRGNFSTVSGGTGDDLISLYSVMKGNVIQYAAGDGNDTVYGYNVSDTVSLTGGSVTDTIIDGNDLILQIETGTIRFVNALQVNVKGTIYGEPTRATDDNDSIVNLTSNITINGYAGDDTIDNGGSQVFIDTGDGNNSVSNYGDSVTIDGGAGNDTVYNYYGNSVSISGGAGDDTVYNHYGNSVSISGGAGDDYVINDGDSVSINGGAGNDTIRDDYGSHLSLNGGAGDDIISLYSYSYYNSVRGGTGNDTMYGSDYSVLYQYEPGDGDDVIYNFKASDVLSIHGKWSKATVGNDIIVTVGDGSVTLKDAASLSSVNIIGDETNPMLIKLTEGNDYHRNTINGATIAAFAGDDEIYNDSSNVSINGGADNDSITNSGNGFNVIINGGEGNDTLTNYGNQITIDAGAGNDSIRNNNSNVTIDAGADNDSISNYDASVSIDGGAGDDYVINGGDSVSINGGAGDDYVINDGDSVSIDSGDGDDSIINKYSGINVTLTGGKGNDSVSNDGAGMVYVYNIGDGDDTIDGFNAYDTLLISGTPWSTQVSDSDVIVYIGNGNVTMRDGTVVAVTYGSIVLRGAASLDAINIVSSASDVQPINIISNTQNDTVITGTSYIDSIKNSGSNVSIDSGAGNDTLHSSGDSVTLNAGDGNDRLYNDSLGSNAKMDSGDGDDTIENKGANVSIDAGYGNDSISNIGYTEYYGYKIQETIISDNVTITSGDGDDTIENKGANVSIDAGTGNDSIYNYGNSISVTAGEGDNRIYNDGAEALITSGAGNDSVYNSTNASVSTVDLGAGNDTLYNYAAHVTMTAGAGDDYIYSRGSNVSIDSGDGDDTIFNGDYRNGFYYSGGSDVTLNGGDGDDTIKSYAASVSIDGGSGNDSIYNDPISNNVTINAGEGDDTISNYSSNVTIDGGEGTDSIYNDGNSNNVTINAGEGDDTISNYGSNVTVDAGTGNDYIRNSGDNVMFIYNDGDGNDSITGFNATSTLQIGDGTGSYFPTVSGDDIIISVGDGSVTLSGAANLSTLNIAGTEVDLTYLTLDDTAATPLTLAAQVITADAAARKQAIKITGNDNDNAIVGGAGNDTLDGGAGDDTLTGGNGADVFLQSTGNDVITDFSADDTFKLDDDAGIYSTQVSGSDIILTVDDGKITLRGAAKLSKLNIADPRNIVGTNGADSITNSLSSATIQALGGADTVNNSSAGVIIDGGTGDDTITNKGANSSIVGGAGSDSITNTKAHVTIAGGTGDDRINLGANASRNVIQYALGDGNDTINQFNATSTLRIGNGTTDTYYSRAQDNDVIVSVGDNSITLTGAAALKSLNIAGVYKNPYSIVGTSKADSITNSLSGATIKALGGADTVNNSSAGVTIDGGTGNDTITNKGANSSIVGGTGSDSITNTKEHVTIAGGTGDDRINLGANASRNVIQYAPGDGNDTINQFNTTSTLRIGNGTTDTYYSRAQDNDVIVSVGDNSITLTGAASLKSLNIAGVYKNPYSIVGTSKADSITNSLSGATIKALGGADTVNNISTGVTIDGGTGNDTITNKGANSSIVGGTGSDSITNTKTNVTIAGGTGDDRINLGASASCNVIQYAPGDGNDTINQFNATSTLRIGNGTTDTYYSRAQDNDVIVSVGGGTITLTGAAALKSLNIAGVYKNPYSIVGTSKADSITNSLSGATIQALGGADTVNNNSTGVIIDGGTGNDTITNKGANSSIVGGAGSDSITNTKAHVTIAGGTGNDLVSIGSNAKNNLIIYGGGSDSIIGYTEDDSIRIASGTAKVTENGGDIILTVGKGTISVKGAADKVVTYSDADGFHTYPNQGIVYIGKTASLTDYYTADSFNIINNLNVTTINASAVKYDIELVGNKSKNSILGGEGNDTLRGAGGNDILTGGEGSDVFIYNSGDGNDLITDYTEEDKLRINAAINRITTTKDDAVVFYLANDGKISVTSGASKVIAYEDAKGKKHFYPVNFNDAGTGATLLAAYTKDNFDVFDYPDYFGTLKTIDASAVDSDIAVTANKNANKIITGTGNDTLIGGKGNDSLNGGNGSDVFIYNSGDGNDTIAGYAEEDKLRINGTVSNRTTSGKNVILTVGDYKINLQGAAGKVITYTDNTAKFNADGTAVTLTNKYTAEVFDVANYPDYAGTVKTINGAAVTHDVSITANSKANTIYGSTNNDYMDGGAGKDVLYGSEGNDTLRGGTGNDTLWGGDGADVFLYKSGDGSDVIKDYAEGEKISITGAAVSKATVSGDDVVLTIGSNKITVTDAAKNKTNVTYYVDGKKKTYKPTSANDLLVDDNYRSDAAQLSQLVEPFKASYTPYDFDAGLSLTRDEKFAPVFFNAKS